MADATVDLAGAVTKISDAVTQGTTVMKQIADTLAAGLPVNGGGGVPTDVVEANVNTLNTLADGFLATIAAVKAEISPKPPVV